jgi:hypothetical protein
MKFKGGGWETEVERASGFRVRESEEKSVG